MQHQSVTRMNLLSDRLCLPLSFEADRLRSDLASMPDEAWVDHFVRDNYEGNWSIVPLRCKQGAVHPIMMIYSDPTAQAFQATDWLKRAPYVQSVLDSFDCPLMAVRLMRLRPGSIIKPHCDHDLSASEGKARLHIPITTNPQVDFRLNDTRVEMATGSTWYLRLSDKHEAANRGTTDRVHLVIDCIINDWLAAQLLAAQDQGKHPSSTIPAGSG
jgi:hypothetical protein